MDGSFARLCCEELSANAHVIAHVEQIEKPPSRFAKVIFAKIRLDFSIAIAKVSKPGLAHEAISNHAAGKRDRLTFEFGVAIQQFLRGAGTVKPLNSIGIVAQLAHARELFQTDLPNRPLLTHRGAFYYRLIPFPVT